MTAPATSRTTTLPSVPADPGPAATRPWVIGLSVATVAGLAAWFAGLTPWLLVSAVTAALALLLGQRWTWKLAGGGAVTLLLGGYAVLLRVGPFKGLPLAVLGGLALAAVAALSLAAVVRTRASRAPVGRVALVGGAVLVGPVVLLAVLGPILAASGWGPTWAMNNDAVWNMVTARHLIDDGGLSAARPNASPLTAGLIAMSAAVGRGGLGAGELLGHDVRRAAELWLAMILAGSAMAALVALQATRRAVPVLRLVAALVTGVAAMSWYFVGFALQFGFYNSSLALVTLLAAWLAWLEAPRTPLAAAIVLAASTIALLATWAPLAVVPLALAAAVLVRALPRLVRGPRITWLWWGLAVAAVTAYGLLVTLGDLGRERAALAVDGGIHALSSGDVAVVTVVTVVVVVLHALRARSIHEALGLAAVLAGSAVGVGYLVFQRVAAGTFLWGYYPIKMAWSVCCLLLVIVLTSTCALLGPDGAHTRSPRQAMVRAKAVVAGAVAAAVAGVLMLQVPGPSLREQLPLFNIARGNGIAALADRARALFDVAEAGVPSIAVRYVSSDADPYADRFLNAWLLQLESVASEEEIRAFSYVLDPNDDDRVCQAIRAWQRPVVVRTKDDGLEARLAGICADVPFTVEVG